MPIKAPYNFVPLSDEVYFPDWADQISMDIPFSDGLSGTIELQLTAESPIYVRNGHTRADKDAQNGTYTAFSKIENQYFIPATTLKGAIRNVLEIMTFSKMGRIADKRYNQRDKQRKKHVANPIKQFLAKDHRRDKPDFSECIFGYVEGDKALRGRVQFSAAFCTNEGEKENEYAPYMGTPQASYYPIYLVQDQKKPVTLLDSNAKLRGWKRYPVRDEWKKQFDVVEGQEENLNPFIPLGKGAKFTAKVRFHNLRPVELGALLSAILFEGNSHSIGFAKAFGFGRTKIEVVSINGISRDIKDLLKEFKQHWNDNDKNINATQSQQWKELLLMSQPQSLLQPLEYMDLRGYQDGKKQDRNSKEYPRFLPYSEIIRPLPIEDKNKIEETVEGEVIAYVKGEVTVRFIVNNSQTVKNFPKPSWLNIKKQKLVKVKIKRKGNNLDRWELEK